MCSVCVDNLRNITRTYEKLVEFHGDLLDHASHVERTAGVEFLDDLSGGFNFLCQPSH